MASTNFIDFAEQIARINGSEALLPAIEKELLHYEILTFLDEAGLLSGLIFQGGTCLRLCYGASRYSEDLDFAGGKDFDTAKVGRLKECLESNLSKKYSLSVDVKEPDADNSLVKKWRITINTSPARPDIPSQKISFEVAAVPAYTHKLRALQLNYDGLPASYEDVLIEAESLEEILADKLEAFICASHIRYRDIWDLQWLSRRPKIDYDKAYQLRKLKEVDYCETALFEEKLPRIMLNLGTIIEGATFFDQMKRFVPVEQFERTIARPEYRANLFETIQELYAPLMK